MGRSPIGRCGRLEFVLLSLLLSLPGLVAEAGDAAAILSSDLESLIADPDALAAAATTGGAASMVASCLTWTLYVPVVMRRLADVGQPWWPALACLAPPALALAGLALPGATAASWVASLALGAWSIYLATARGVPTVPARRHPSPSGRPGTARRPT